MGKKSASMKISKNNNNKSEKNKKDFNSWLSVLRPKVYITDSSSFKSLVQELTGNGNSSSSSPSSSPTLISSSSPSMEEPQVVVLEPDSSTDVTIDASINDDSSADQHDLHSSQVLLTSTMTDQDHHHHHHHRDYDQVVCDQIWLDNTSLEDLMANQQDIHDQVEDLLAYGSLESWLSDIEHHPYSSYSFCNNGFVQNEQEVSIYDYELSGLL